MKDPDQPVTWDYRLGADLPERFWAYEDPDVAVDDDAVDDPATGLIDLRFLGAVLRRGRLLWCGLAVVGLLLGSAYYVAFPSAQKATATVLLADDPNQDPAIEVETDIALAQSTAVADGAISQLGLQETASSFSQTYTVSQVTDHVLMITASSPTSAEAVRIASAVATQFLKARAQYSQGQLQTTRTELAQQVSQAQQNLDSINSQVKQVAAETSTPGQQGQLASLKAQSTQANIVLAEVRDYATVTVASMRVTTQDMVHGSQVLDAAAPAKHSILKSGAVYVIGGLLGGLILGMAIVVIGGVTSDRLRRRDDIAYAIGAPVRLSVGPLHESRWLPRLFGRTVRRRDLERVVEHLGKTVPGSSHGPAGLAVVAVDDTRTVARAVVMLALSNARRGRRVVLADLSADASAARQLGGNKSGIHMVGPDSARIALVIPTASEAAAPVGPLQSHTSPHGYAEADESLIAARDNADLLLSLVTLDPGLGAEHLATWATDAVVVTTAGLSSGVRINAAGEMIRLSGTRLSSVVVIDADKRDESLGSASSTPSQTAPL